MKLEKIYHIRYSLIFAVNSLIQEKLSKKSNKVISDSREYKCFICAVGEIGADRLYLKLYFSSFFGVKTREF
jgi:hypothetical protein